MFTLGNKEAIVNSPAQYPFSPATANTATLNIQGFGTFDQTKIVSAVARRASLAQFEKLTFTCPDAAALGIAASDVGIAVVVHLRVNSLRQASESAIDFIKRGRPMILEIKVNGGDTAATIAITTLAAFNEYEKKFFNITLPITAAIGTVNTDIDLRATAGYYQINDSVTFLKRGDIFAYDCVTTKAFDSTFVVNGAVAGNATVISLDDVSPFLVNDTVKFTADGGVTFSQEYKIVEIVTAANDITIFPAVPAVPDIVNGDAVWRVIKGIEAVNDGKYLEENVRMSTPFTSDAYAINPGQVPIIDGKYTMISFKIDPTNSVGTWQPHAAPGAVALAIPTPTYTLYFNEATCLGATSPVKYLLDWLLGNGNVVFGNLKKANGASCVSVADFWA